MLWIQPPAESRQTIRADQSSGTNAYSWTLIPGCSITMPWAGTATVTSLTVRTQGFGSNSTRITVNGTAVTSGTTPNGAPPQQATLSWSGTLAAGDTLRLEVQDPSAGIGSGGGSWIEVAPT